MSWIDRIFNKNSTVSNSRKANVPEGVWTKCTSCEQVLYRDELKRHLEVCPKCGHHMRIDARERLLALLDKNSAQEIAEELGLLGVVNEDETLSAVRQAIEENPKAVDDYLAGQKASLNFLVGQVMRLTRGKADPGETVKLLRENIE